RLGRLLSLLKRGRGQRDSGGMAVVEAPERPQHFQAIVVVVDKGSGATENQLYTTEQAPTAT
ncbi:hypothetical protein KR018_002419, partial [Drosophila ironensis]